MVSGVAYLLLQESSLSEESVNELKFSLDDEGVTIGFNELMEFILSEIGRQKPELVVENELNSADISFDVDHLGYPEMRIIFNNHTPEEKAAFLKKFN